MLQTRDLIWALLFFGSAASLQVNIIPAQGEISVGESKFFLCAVTGEVTNIDWYAPSGEKILPNRQDISVSRNDEASSTLTLYNADIDDAGVYKCVASHGETEAEATVNMKIFQKLTFKNSPSPQEFKEGDDAIIVCDVVSSPPPTIIWKHKGVKIQVEKDVRFRILGNNHLQIRGIKKTDEGSYTCEARIMARGEIDFRIIRVIVNVLPTIRTRQPELNATADIGQSVVLACDADGYPEPTVTWARDNIILEAGSKYSFNEDGSEMTIKDVKKVDQGDYKCIARNKAGEKEQEISLNVFVKPKITYTENKTALELEEQISLTCEASGDPTPNIVWSFGRRVFTEGEQEPINRIYQSLDRNIEVRSDARVSSLTLKYVQFTDAGQYLCTARNSIGQDSQFMYLEVHYAPKIQGPVTSYTWEGNPANITCDVIAHPSASVVWFRDGQQLPSSNASNIKIYNTPSTSFLEVTPESQSDFGSYNCTATNRIGTESREFLLIQAEVPSAPVINEVDPYSSSAHIDFDEPDASGGVPILKYKAEWRVVGLSEWMHKEYEVKDGYNDNTIVISGLKPETSYEVRMSAINGKGEGDKSQPTIFKTQPVHYPYSMTAESPLIEERGHVFLLKYNYPKARQFRKKSKAHHLTYLSRDRAVFGARLLLSVNGEESEEDLHDGFRSPTASSVQTPSTVEKDGMTAADSSEETASETYDGSVDLAGTPEEMPSNSHFSILLTTEDFPTTPVPTAADEAGGESEPSEPPSERDALEEIRSTTAFLTVLPAEDISVAEFVEEGETTEAPSDGTVKGATVFSEPEQSHEVTEEPLAAAPTMMAENRTTMAAHAVGTEETGAPVEGATGSTLTTGALYETETTEHQTATGGIQTMHSTEVANNIFDLVTIIPLFDGQEETTEDGDVVFDDDQDNLTSVVVVPLKEEEEDVEPLVLDEENDIATLGPLGVEYITEATEIGDKVGYEKASTQAVEGVIEILTPSQEKGELHTTLSQEFISQKESGLLNFAMQEATMYPTSQPATLPEVISVDIKPQSKETATTDETTVATPTVPGFENVDTAASMTTEILLTNSVLPETDSSFSDAVTKTHIEPVPSVTPTPIPPSSTVVSADKGEPSPPKLDGRVMETGNSMKVNWIKQDDGGSPIRHYLVRYKPKHMPDWKPEIRLPSDSEYAVLSALDWNTEYEVYVVAENQQGKSQPGIYYFRTPPEPTAIPDSVASGSGLSTGAIVGILIVVFVILLVVVDVTCYFLNKCGLLMCIAVNFCGKSGPGAKGKDIEEGKAAFSKDESKEPIVEVRTEEERTPNHDGGGQTEPNETTPLTEPEHPADTTATVEDMLPSVATNSDTVTETFATAQNSPTSETTTLTSSTTAPAADPKPAPIQQASTPKAGVATPALPPAAAASDAAPQVAPLVDLSDAPAPGGPGSAADAPKAPSVPTAPAAPPPASEPPQPEAAKGPGNEGAQTSVAKSPAEAVANPASPKSPAVTDSAANQDFQIDGGPFKTSGIDLAKDVFAALGSASPPAVAGKQTAEPAAAPADSAVPPAPAQDEKVPVDDKSKPEETEVKKTGSEVKTVPNEATQTNANESKA
nr:PREDICTED: neural cell adhesion molecule 1 isoform X4 [Lepisosteus oculatus]